jgi:hypothetical protein
VFRESHATAYLPHPPRRVPLHRLYELWSMLPRITSPRAMPQPLWTYLRTYSETNFGERPF